MNEEVDPHVEQAARWVRWAREDLVLAHSAHKDPDAVARGACTWAHQCAEKALKAMVVIQGIDPPKTHNLLQLELLVSSEFAETLAAIDLETLTRWSIEGRYPEDLEEATATDATTHAIDTASAVLRAVQETLDPLTEVPGEDR